MGIRADIPAQSLTEMGHADLQALMKELGQPKFRAKQIYQWVFQKGARSFDAMTNLPKSLRTQLIEAGYTVGRVTRGRVAESIDGTIKLSIRLEGGGAVESVLIPMGGGKFTQCVSSQLGCALDCKFCYTGTLGLSRHLTPGEIVDQVLIARDAIPEGCRITNIVYMGMGEPLHNFDNVLLSLEPLRDPDGLNYSLRRITISTSGLVPQIEKLAELAPVNLAISLNATTDAVRDQIMPINKRYPIKVLMAALRAYPVPNRRKLTIEYVLMGDLNDSDTDARRLCRLLDGMEVRVNLIPWNPFEGPGYKRPNDERVRTFQRILDRAGVTVTVRRTKGLDIDAACGQLGERPPEETA